MSDSIIGALGLIALFKGESLRDAISKIEHQIQGQDGAAFRAYGNTKGINHELFSAALDVKKVSAQIDNIVHALGIMMAIPKILKPDEKIEAASLAAGNTGRKFDLETNQRVMEFKFNNWVGGAETIRQNALFKDFFYLAEYDGPKERCMYVIGIDHPSRFLQGGRSLASVTSKNRRLENDFREKYGERFKVVGDYYNQVKNRVRIEDLASILPELVS